MLYLLAISFKKYYLPYLYNSKSTIALLIRAIVIELLRVKVRELRYIIVFRRV
jgi:hypothetical protein